MVQFTLLSVICPPVLSTSLSVSRTSNRFNLKAKPTAAALALVRVEVKSVSLLNVSFESRGQVRWRPQRLQGLERQLNQVKWSELFDQSSCEAQALVCARANSLGVVSRAGDPTIGPSSARAPPSANFKITFVWDFRILEFWNKS